MTHFNQVSNMAFDEVSFVDVPANPHARVLITKAATAGEAVMPENEQFEEVTLADLEIGDIVDLDGELVEVDETFLQQIGVEIPDSAAELDLEPVGKSADLVAGIRAALAKSAAAPEVVAAVEALAKRAQTAETQAAQATTVAKSVHDAYMLEQYTSRAAEYGIPGVDAADLGEVMKSASEALPEEHCAFLNDLFTHAGELSKAAYAFEEVGKSAGNDPFGLVPAALAEAAGDMAEAIAKNANGQVITKGDALVAAIESNPALYDTYLADQRSRSFGIG